MSIQIITTIVSALSIITGSLLGAYFSYTISKKMQKQEIDEQHKIIIDNRKYEESNKLKQIKINANIIRLDISTAIFQSIRSIKNSDVRKCHLYILPLNHKYSECVASLSSFYSLQQLSDIYQLYGIIEKVNRDMYFMNFYDNKSYGKVKNGFKSILYKIYGKNYYEILSVNPDKIKYDDLYQNEYINKNYKELFEQLNELCNLNNK